MPVPAEEEQVQEDVSAVDARVLAQLARTTSPGALARAALRRDLVGADAVLEVLGDDPDALANRALLAFGGVSADLRAGLELHARALAARGAGSGIEHLDLALQAAVVLGDDSRARELLAERGVDPWVAWAAEVDLTAGHDGWLERLNAPFVDAGLEPVRVAAGDGSAFDRLTSAVPDVVEDGPLVSVVVSVFRPGPSFEPAVQSLLAQTWRPLEVLLVDDANDPADAARILDLAATDDRVRILRQDVNGGTYRGRNRALREARGELFGFQDADDWMHPRRLERQVRELQAHEHLVAVSSRAVRLHEDLRITRVGAPPFTLNLPSLLVRREPVVRRLGGFDPVRKAADLEFVRRLETVFGPEAARTLEEPLTLYQLSHGSLSRADFRLSWHHPSRHAYHSGFSRWHRRTSARDLRLDPDGPRPFAAPAHLGGPDADQRVAVAVWADLRERGPGGRLAVELVSLARTVDRVGVLGGEPARRSSRRREEPADRVLDLVDRGVVAWLDPSRECSADVLVVRDPELLVLPPSRETWHVRAERVVLAAGRAPQSDDGLLFDPTDVERAAQVLTGASEVQWWAADTDVVAGLAAWGVEVTGPVGRWEVLGPVRSPQPVTGATVVGLLDDLARPTGAGTGAGTRPRAPHGVDARVLGRGRGGGWVPIDDRRVGRRAFSRTCDVVLVPQDWPRPDRDAAWLDVLEEGAVPVLSPEREVVQTLHDPAERDRRRRSLLAEAARDYDAAWARRLPELLRR